MIPVSAPIISSKAKKYVNDCIETGWISSQGKYVNQFEEQFAGFLGRRFAISTTSGTAALHLALAALGIGQGDEVIVTTFTMIAPVFAVCYVGAKPVLVDAEADTWNMDISQVEKKISKKTRAVIAVHIYGHPVDMDPLIKLCKKYKLFLVEDAAEGLGALYKGRKIGTFGDIACFSFYANKTITTGEGGMVVTDKKALATKLRAFKDMAHSPKKRFLHTDLAFTYRMTNMQAALGFAQLQNIEKIIAKKRAMADLYSKYLKGIPGIILPVEKPWAKNVYWMYGILISKEFGMSRDQLRKRLYRRGVDTRDFFIPMHIQPVFKKIGFFKGEKYPVSEAIAAKGLYLPSGPAISQSQIKEVCLAIKNIHGKL